MKSLARKLAEYIVDLQYEQLPTEVVQLTRVTFLDWLGNATAGANMPPAEIVRAIAEHQGGVAQATIFGPNGAKTRSSLLMTSLVNGTSSHIVELDDVHKTSILHAGTVVIPTALALAEHTHASGRKFIEAIVAGFDVCIRIGEAVTPSHYKHFHTTGTAGTFGAAAAAAKLLDLTVEETTHALATAGTQAAGLWEFVENGSMSKHLHSGKAGMNGMLSALLAKKGFTGADTILEGSRGFMQSLADEYDADKVVDGLGMTYKILENCFKIHSSCRHTHHAIDLVIGLVKAHNLAPADIARMHIGTYQVALDITDNPNPTTVYAAKFSLQYCAALAAVRRRAGLDDFTPEMVADGQVRDVLSKVQVDVNPAVQAIYPNKWGAQVDITTVEGQTFCAKTDYPKGDFENPVSESEISDKFKELVRPYLSDMTIDKMVSRSLSLNDIADVATFFD